MSAPIDKCDQRLAGDALHQEHPDRCRICALPLPVAAKGQANDGICSRRCAGLRGQSAAVLKNTGTLTQKILSELTALRPDITICPGELSRRVLPGAEPPLTVLRPLIFELAAARRLRLSQKGRITLWWKIHGPFRVQL